MNTQTPGTCRRFIEFCFDVDDTERLSVVYVESYPDKSEPWPCEIMVGGKIVQRYPDYDVPYGCTPDITIAEMAAAHYLKFNTLKP